MLRVLTQSSRCINYLPVTSFKNTIRKMADEVKAAQSATKDPGPTIFDKIIDKSIPAGNFHILLVRGTNNDRDFYSIIQT
jgi:hypothetical protein